MSQPVTLMEASRYEQVCSADQVADLTPAEVREAMAFWVGRERLDIAQVLVDAGMLQFPQSPDILAVGALLAEIQQDWDRAQNCLQALMDLQGDAATAESHLHLVRVMRCRAAYFSAWRHSLAALQAHPDHEGLQQEFDELSELLADAPQADQLQASTH
ncbi:MAG: hypothetical protein QE494_08665 [Ramlibacter sp.]|jgi:hypothetical protein|uniref:hypothetical protein n=1 Tax=Ramlibacter sp. TaxID=1917967 RepID=UPI002631C478|nr:hypothetical protein [Ramlibacter sp.]MDH4376357.1 hypothetical protein [Ramlibacter sp.]